MRRQYLRSPPGSAGRTFSLRRPRVAPDRPAGKRRHWRRRRLVRRFSGHLDGTIVVGAPSHASKARAAYVFTNYGKGWQATEIKGSDTVAKDDFGDAVAVSGTTIVVGVFGHKSEAGRAYVFAKGSGGWHQSAELFGSGTVAGDAFGDSVAVGGRIIGSELGWPPQTQAGSSCSPRRRQVGTKSPNWRALTLSTRMISAIRSPSRGIPLSSALSLKALPPAGRTFLLIRPPVGTKAPS